MRGSRPRFCLLGFCFLHQQTSIMTPQKRAIPSKRERRGGVATVEMAVCLPVLVLITFAAIETANVVFLKQALSASAYEAARVATQDGATKLKALDRAQQVLDARNIQNYSVQFSPNSVNTNTARGTAITVTISAPATANSVGVQCFYKTDTLESSTTMVRQ